VNPFLCADWKFLSYAMGFAPANTTLLHQEVCGFCHVDKEFIVKGWLAEYPFATWPVTHRPVRELPSLPNDCVRYCAMHGCNRLLDNSLRVLTSLGAKKNITTEVQRACPRWGAKAP